MNFLLNNSRENRWRCHTLDKSFFFKAIVKRVDYEVNVNLCDEWYDEINDKYCDVIAIQIGFVDLTKCSYDENDVEDESDDAENSELLHFVMIALR